MIPFAVAIALATVVGIITGEPGLSAGVLFALALLLSK